MSVINGSNDQREFKGRTEARLITLERQTVTGEARLGKLSERTAKTCARLEGLEADMGEIREAIKEACTGINDAKDEMSKFKTEITGRVSSVTSTVRTWGAIMTLLIALFGFLMAYQTFIRGNGTRVGACEPPTHTTAPARTGGGGR